MLTGKLVRSQLAISISVFCLLLASVFASICEPEPGEDSENSLNPQSAWHIYIVDEGVQSSIDVDSSRLPHISYRGLRGGFEDFVLRYASWNNGNWSIQTVDNRSGAGHTSVLVLDSRDIPRIAHWDSRSHPDSATLKMATRIGANWELEAIDNETSGYISIGLALGSNELPRVSYLKEVHSRDRDLWLAELSENGSWELEMIDETGDVRYPSLSIDSRDHYHISYQHYEVGNALRYAYWNGSAWNIERVGAQGVYGSWSSIGTDNKGCPHIAFYDFVRKMVSYATKTNGSWETTSIDYMFGPGLSLDLDSQMHPHISYQGLDLNLRHAWWDGSSWQIEIVDSSYWVGEFSSIRIDENDDIHISYSRLDLQNHTGYFIKYATTNELPAGVIQTSIDIDPDTLNLKSKGKFITAYIELEGADVRDINASSILLNDALSPILDAKYGFVTSEDSYIVDNDQDGIMERMVKFDRNEVQRLLAPSEEVVLTIVGSLYDGTEFEGTDTIRVISK